MRKVSIGLALLFSSFACFAGCAMLQPSDEPAPRFKSSTEHYNAALEHYQKGRYAKAKELFHEYVAQYPDSAIFRIALYYLGHCYQMLGEEKEALVIFNRVVATYGDDDFWGEQALNRIRQIKGEQ